MSNVLELTHYRVWLHKMGLEETDFIISRPITFFLNSNEFGQWHDKAEAAEKFAKQYKINKIKR